MELTSKLNRSKFFIELFTINQKFTFEQVMTAAKQGIDHLEYGSESQKYAKKTLYGFIDLITSIEGLEETPIFFSINKIPSYFTKKGISEINYYKYHLENHYIKISSILDYTSHFINLVYSLGIPPRKCNPWSILENLNVKGTLVGNSFNAFNKHFENIKQNRNIIIHKGKYESEEIKSIDSTIMSSNLIKMDKILIDWFNERRQKEVQKVIEMFHQNNKAVSDHILNLSDNLVNPFINRYNYLKTLETE